MRIKTGLLVMVCWLPVTAALAQDGGAPAQPQAVPVETIAVDEPPAPATPAEEPAPQQAVDRGAARLEDIIVTATKREKSVREIAGSVSALRGEDLEKIGARDIKDYIMQVPGITFDENAMGDAGGRKLTIRGIGPPQTVGNATVGQFIGDVPLTDPYFNFTTPDLDPFDLKTVEVLKGPQGTTFGATALNGAIRYVPNAPELGQWNGHGFIDRTAISQGGAGMTYGAEFNAPIGDSLALRGSGVLQHQPGFYDNIRTKTPDADARRKWSGRVMGRWQPTERLDATVTWLKQQSHTNDVLVADNNDGELVNHNKPQPSTISNGFSLANIDARYRIDDWGTVVWQSTHQTKNAYLDFDGGIAATGALGVESLRQNTLIDIRGNTHELRLVSPDGGNWNWIVGAFLMQYSADVDGVVYVPLGLGLGPILSGLPLLSGSFTPLGLSVSGQHIHPLDATEMSFYGELSRKFGPDWELTLGARRYDTRLSGSVTVDGVGNSIPGVSIQKGQDIDQKESGVSPKASLVWKPVNGIMSYVTVSRGFQFGGINIAQAGIVPFPNPVTGGPVPVQFRSSTLWNYEIGLRTEWLERTLRIDTTLYDVEWTDAQLNQTLNGLLITPGYIDNIGTVRSQGIETNIAWLTPLPGLSLNLAAAYGRSATAEPYKDPNGSTLPSGTAVAAAPRWQTATTVSYTTYVGPWIGSASLVHSLWSKAYNNLQHSFEIYGFNTLSLNLNVARPDLPLAPSLTVGLSNLLDERGVVGRDGTTDSTANAVGSVTTYIRPRTLSLRLAMEF